MGAAERTGCSLRSSCRSKNDSVSGAASSMTSGGGVAGMDMLAAGDEDGSGAKAAPATAALASASITPSALAAGSGVALVDGGAAGSGAPLGDGAESGASGEGWGGVPAVPGPVIGS